MKPNGADSGRTAFRTVTRLIAAAVLITAGSVLVLYGGLWAPAALRLLGGSAAGAWIELLLPFAPLVIIACGAVVLVSVRH